jgi:hypothetical protein
MHCLPIVAVLSRLTWLSCPLRATRCLLRSSLFLVFKSLTERLQTQGVVIYLPVTSRLFRSLENAVIPLLLSYCHHNYMATWESLSVDGRSLGFAPCPRNVRAFPFFFFQNYHRVVSVICHGLNDRRIVRFTAGVAGFYLL